MALKKLEAHRDAALNQLAKMSSEKETTRAGEVADRFDASNPQQQQMEMMVRQRMRQAGKKNKKAPEKPIAVTCTVTAEWKLEGQDSGIELLLEAQAIEDKVRAADLAGGDTEEKTAEEEELAEEMEEQMPNFNDDEVSRSPANRSSFLSARSRPRTAPRPRPRRLPRPASKPKN